MNEYECPRCGSHKVDEVRGWLVCDVCDLAEPLIDFLVRPAWSDYYEGQHDGRYNLQPTH